jgi:hypothetical protein
MGDDDRVFYRVIGGNAKRYAYTDGEPEIMELGAGRQKAERPIFEFESLQSIGAWLFLGNRVRRLRVPPGVPVVRNQPMSQGGCYSFASDEVELLDVVDFPALMRELDATDDENDEIGLLHFERFDFPSGFAFPKRVSWLILDRCFSVAPLAFPAKLDRLALWSCALNVASFPTRRGFRSDRLPVRGPRTASSIVQGERPHRGWAHRGKKGSGSRRSRTPERGGVCCSACVEALSGLPS